MAAAGCNHAARPERQQQSLLPQFEGAAAERRALVRGALATLGLRSDMARGLEALVLYLAACSDSDGCRARQAVIARQLGVSARTVRRQLAALVAAGWAQVTASLRDRVGGQGANRVVLDWGAIRAAARGRSTANPAAQPTAPAAASGWTLPAAKSVHPVGQTVHPGGQTVLPPNKEHKGPVLGTCMTTTTPTPPPPIESEPGRGGPPDRWAAVAGDLLAAGVAQAGQVVRELASAGASPARVRAIIGWHAAQRGRYGPGALVARLRADLPGLPLESGWPAPRPRAGDAGDVGDTARERAGRARAERDAADRARSAGERAESARLEREQGAALDGLSLAERDALAETGLSPAERSFYGRELRRPVVRDPLVRRLLLGALGAISQGTNAEEVMR